MKKIRILAVVLAVLMLPFGLLISCNNNTNPDDPADSSSWTTGPIDTQEVTTLPPVDDGTAEGYLLYFTFDNAPRGEFRTDLEPYNSYFTFEDSKEGALYLVDDKGGVNGGGALLIQREGANSDAYVEFSTLKMGSSFIAQHTFEFDINIGEGLVGDGINIYSRKELNGACSQVFVRITEDGVYDGDGSLLYEFPAFGWYHISVAVDDEARVYDIYVDGGKMTNGTKYSNINYPVFSEQRLTTYRIALNATSGADTYAYIDNFSICTGLEPSERDTDKDDITYKDNFTEVLKAFEVSKEGALDAMNRHGFTGSNLTSLFSVYKVNKNNMSSDTEIPLMYDYSVEVGGKYGGEFGGTIYVDKTDNSKYLQFVSDANYTINTNIRGSVISGTYSIAGTEDEPEARFSIQEGALERTYYSILRDGTLYLYSDYNLTKLEGEFVLFESDIPFNGVQLVVDEENFYMSILIDDYFGEIDFIVHAGDDNLELPSAEYTYNNGVLTITADGKDFTFNYADGKLTYGSGDDTKTFEEYVDNSKWETTGDETLAIKWQNFVSGKTQLDFYADVEEGTGPQWTNIRFNYYIPQESVNYTFMVIVDTGNSSEGWSYYSKTFKASSPGWYTFDETITSMGQSRTPDMERFTGKISITTAGWSNGPAGGTAGTAADGYALYFQDIELYAERSIVVQGPEEGKENCTHNYVPSDNFVEATCTENGYYPLICSECGAVKIDLDRQDEMTLPKGHNYEGAQTERVEPTCSTKGCVYHFCVDCGNRAVKEEIDAIGHDYVTRYDANSRELRQTCKNCGIVSTLVLSEKSLTTEEKISALNLATNQYFAVYNGLNENYSYGSFTGENAVTLDTIVMINAKKAKFYATPIRMFKYERGTQSDTDAYVDIRPNSRYKGNHVIEFTLMLGEAVNGKYPALNSTYKDRTSGFGDMQVFKTDENGLLTFTNDTSCTVQLSESKATHFSLVIKPGDNLFDVYIDDYLQYSIPMTNDSTKNASTFLGVDFRISYQNRSGEGGMSFYINDMMTYEGDYPVCVMGMGNVSGGNEYGGDIALEGNITDGKVLVNENNEILTLPKYVLTSAYVLDFTLTADALANGALLAGNKTDVYGFENELDLITVKNGYIYVLDRAVCKVEDAKDGVRFTLAIDDGFGDITVYIDGTEVKGGTVKYPDGYYGSEGAMIKSIVFKSEVGAYEISGLDMYTGFSVKE